jgi:hypothetical protein
MPAQIIVKNSSDLTVKITSSITTSGKINTNPVVKFYSFNQTISSSTSNTSYLCASSTGCLLLTNLSSNIITVQNITLEIGGLINIPYVGSIDSIIVRTYFDG